MKQGKKVWIFVDGYLPQKGNSGIMEAHEALMLLNLNDTVAEAIIDVYFEDREPAKGIKVVINAERVKTLRLDHPEDLVGLAIPPLTQYSLRVSSNKNLVVQFGRLDTTQNNMAYYGVAGYYE